MLVESLKRRHFGLDDSDQPPTKVRACCDRIHIQNKLGAGDQLPGETHLKSKRRLSINETEDTSNDVLTTNLKRRCLREEDDMQIKASAQYLQSPAKRSKKNRKRNRKSSKNQDQQPSTSASGSESENPENPAYNDMVFWRPVLPDIEKELVQFFEDTMDISDAATTITDGAASSDAEDPHEYNAFNFWRVPILDADLAAIH